MTLPTKKTMVLGASTNPERYSYLAVRRLRNAGHPVAAIGRMIATVDFARSIAAIIAFSNWEEWLNLLLGLWLIGSPWVLGFAHTRAMHVSIGLGAMVAFIAALELWLVNFGPQYGSG